MRHRPVSVGALLLPFLTLAGPFLAPWSAAAQSGAIATSFEAGEPDPYPLGGLGGHHAWRVTAGSAAVAEGPSVARTGVRGVRLSAVSGALAATHEAVPESLTGLGGVVHFDLTFRIPTGAGKLTLAGNDAWTGGGARLFVIDVDAPPGRAATVRAYERYGKVELGTVAPGSWHRLTGRADLERGLWQARLDAGPFATMSFRDPAEAMAPGRAPGAREYHRLSVEIAAGSGAMDVALDDLRVGPAAPPGVTFPPFAPMHTLKVVPPVGGTIRLSPEGPRHPPGTVVTALFQPAPGFRLAQWLGALEGGGLTRTLLVDRDLTIGAETAVDPGAPGAGRSVPVATVAALREALAAAAPGDVIEIADGRYLDAGRLVIEHGGAAGAPVIVRARRTGGVVFAGASAFLVRRSAHVVLQGFVFESSLVPAIELESCHRVRVTRHRFRLAETGPGDWVRIGGDFEVPQAFSGENRIDHCRFEAKRQLGNFVVIDGGEAPYPECSRHDRIDRNHFLDTAPRGSNGKEAVRLGRVDLWRSSAHTVVEANLFEHCDGDAEIVSVKSSDDSLRGNTFRACQGSVTLRHGDRSVVAGNFFLGAGKAGSGGVRLYGEDQRVVNNYFADLTGTGIHAAIAIPDAELEAGDPMDPVLHFRSRRAVVAFNTIAGGAQGIRIGGGGGASPLPTTDLVIACNLMTSDQGELVRIETEPPGCAWRSNLLWPTGAARWGIGPSPGRVAIADPLLAWEGGVRRPAPGSPVVDRGLGGPDDVLRDMDGQLRVAPDIGADERSSDPILARPLLAADVGPDAVDGERLAGVAEGGATVALRPAGPHPFTSTATLAFALESEGPVTLEVFDVQGRRIATLLEQRLGAGRHRVAWNSAGAPAGLYLARLRTAVGDAAAKLVKAK